MLTLHDFTPLYGLLDARQLQAIRDSRWKLVFPHTYATLNGRPGGTDGRPVAYEFANTELALYDLDSDVSETTDVKDRHPDIVNRLQQAANEIKVELGEGEHYGPGVRLPRQREPVTSPVKQ